MLAEELWEGFKDVVLDPLNKEPMNGAPMTIYPTRITAAKKIPIHWLELARDAINKLLRLGVLPVEDEPIEWIEQGFFVPKGCPEE